MIEVYQLKNQLRLVLVPLAELPSVAVVGMVKTGSRYDKPEKKGLAGRASTPFHVQGRVPTQDGRISAAGNQPAAAR